MKKLIIVSGLLLLMGSCYNDKYDKLYVTPTPAACDTTTITYAHDIAPIFTAHCNISGGCHDAAGASTSGYDFTEYVGIASIATKNILLNDINFTPSTGYHTMPKDAGKLDQCTINKITRWVNQGAPNN